MTIYLLFTLKYSYKYFYNEVQIDLKWTSMVLFGLMLESVKIQIYILINCFAIK